MTHDELVQNIMRLWGEVEALKQANPGSLVEVVKLRDRVTDLEKLNQDRAALVNKPKRKKSDA